MKKFFTFFSHERMFKINIGLVIFNIFCAFVVSAALGGVLPLRFFVLAVFHLFLAWLLSIKNKKDVDVVEENTDKEK